MTHQLFEALVSNLDNEGEAMSEVRRAKYLRAFDSMLQLVYGEPGEALHAATPMLALPAPEPEPAMRVEATAPAPAAQPARRVPRSATLKPTSPAASAAPGKHTGRHKYIDGRCEKCGAFDPRLTDPATNPFMNLGVRGEAAASVDLDGETQSLPRNATEHPVMYCRTVGCRGTYGADGTCSDCGARRSAA